MNADFLAVLEFWEREKGISRDVLVGAVQEALLSAAKKAVGPARELRVAIDPKNGDIKAFAKLIVSDRVISKHDQISVFDARRIKGDAQIGEELEVEVTPVGFGRIAAQTAKQVILQKIRESEKDQVISDFQNRIGEIGDAIGRLPAAAIGHVGVRSLEGNGPRSAARRRKQIVDANRAVNPPAGAAIRRENRNAGVAGIVGRQNGACCR